jgi:hypothetical protein
MKLRDNPLAARKDLFSYAERMSRRWRLSGSGSAGCAAPLQIAQIPSTAQSAVEIDQGQFAAEVISDCCALRRIHLDLGINNIQIGGKPAVVADGGEAHGLAIGVNRGELFAVSLA